MIEVNNVKDWGRDLASSPMYWYRPFQEKLRNVFEEYKNREFPDWEVGCKNEWDLYKKLDTNRGTLFEMLYDMELSAYSLHQIIVLLYKMGYELDIKELTNN